MMTTSLAPRPANEERRAKAVIQTGLIDNPKPELFQVYCDLAKDITDFDTATFSLFDNDFQCGMASAGRRPADAIPHWKSLSKRENVAVSKSVISFARSQ